MSATNVLFDLPSCVIREVCLTWLCDARFKAVQLLDSAVCCKHLRPSLLEIYQYMDWENFLVLSSGHEMTKKMKWSVARQIKPPKLAVSNFPHEPDLMKSFFRCSGKTLKVLRLTDFYGAMTGLTKIVARECKLLETLCLERCNLTVPIADILNQTATIKEVRLQNRVQRYGRRRHYPRESQMKRSLLERIQCNTVTKLALLDRLNVGDVDIIARAFPKVTHFEIMDPSAPLLSKFLAEYPSMECVRLVEISTLGDELVSAVQGHGLVTNIQVQTSPRNLHISPSIYRILPMRSIAITCDLNLRDGLRLIAEYSNVSLEVLKLDGYNVSTTPADLTALGEHCPNLRVLHLRVFTEFSSYESVLNGCAKLEELWFGDCILASVEQVASSIVANCQNLETVAFNNNANNQKFTSLLRTCPKLHNIGFAQWSNHYSNYADRPKHDSAEFQF